MDIISAKICRIGRRSIASAPRSDSSPAIKQRFPHWAVRLGPDRLLITPSGFGKGFLSADQLLRIDMRGVVIPSHHPGTRGLKPSSETMMHLEAYQRRPDVQAVIHAHPPLAIALTQRSPTHRALRIQGMDGNLRDIAVTALPLFAHEEELVGAAAIFWEHPPQESDPAAPGGAAEG